MKRYGDILTETPIPAKIAIIDQNCIWIWDLWLLAHQVSWMIQPWIKATFVYCGWWMTKRHTSVNLVYDSKPRHHFNQSTARPKRAEKSLIICIGKSEAEVTNNNKRVCSRYCTVGANYRQAQSLAWPLCDSWTSCSLYRLKTGAVPSVFPAHCQWKLEHKPVGEKMCIKKLQLVTSV